MEKIKPATQEERILGGLVYLIMFIGLLGWIIDGILYWTLKKKFTKLHAGQACLIELIFLLLSFALLSLFPLFMGASFLLPGSLAIVTMSLGVIQFIIIIVLAITAFIGEGIQLPFMIRLVEKRLGSESHKPAAAK